MDLHEEGQSNPSDPSDEFEIIEANIWNSVLIIKKGEMGIDPEDIDDMKGVISAAREEGATDSFEDKRHIFGFACTDWIDSQKNILIRLLNPDQYEKFSLSWHMLFVIMSHI
eukprot:442469_1